MIDFVSASTRLRTISQFLFEVATVCALSVLLVCMIIGVIGIIYIVIKDLRKEGIL